MTFDLKTISKLTFDLGVRRLADHYGRNLICFDHLRFLLVFLSDKGLGIVFFAFCA